MARIGACLRIPRGFRGIAALRPWLVWVMAIAFTSLADILITVGGHAGELAFSTYCYTLAWTGGRTDTPQERVACAMAGGLLQFSNLKLCFGLMTSAAARSHYATNGSIGLKNDYLVMSENLLHCPLTSVALAMFVVALSPLPLGILIGHLARTHERASDGSGDQRQLTSIVSLTPLLVIAPVAL